MDRHTRRGLQLALGLGAGIGLMAGALTAALMRRPGLTDDEVTQRARSLGMVKMTELPQAAPARETPAKTIVAYTVQPGMSFGEIAAMLKQAGALVDEQALLARAQERGALEKVKAGVYALTVEPGKPPTPDQIIDQWLQGPS